MVSHTELQDPLLAPDELSSEEKWIVRIHGKDLGPFSNRDLYPMLLKGDIAPDTLLLDQSKFTRSRLADVPDFNLYLHLYNTQNPILLEEERRKERDQHWREKGRKRAIIATVVVLTILIGGPIAYFKLRPSQDVYMEDGDFQLAMPATLKGVALKSKKPKDWSYKRKRRYRRRKKGNKSGGGSQAVTNMDFGSGGGGGGIPRAALSSKIQRKVGRLVSCITAQKERDNRFDGATIRFTIAGNLGKITSVGLEDTDFGSRLLIGCIRRRSRRWSFQRFGGTAQILLPIHIKRRSRW